MMEWIDDLVWCPSQCYTDVRASDGTPYVLYLRWRWDDPWEAHFIRNTTRDRWGKESSSMEMWSRDVFEENRVCYGREDDLSLIKEILLGFFENANAENRLADYYGARLKQVRP